MNPDADQAELGWTLARKDLTRKYGAYQAPAERGHRDMVWKYSMENLDERLDLARSIISAVNSVVEEVPEF